MFELNIKEEKQQVVHRQEIPKREETSIVSLHSTQPINTVIWCLNNGNNQMMLFPEDY